MPKDAKDAGIIRFSAILGLALLLIHMKTNRAGTGLAQLVLQGEQAWDDWLPLLDETGLKLVNMQPGLYITTPANAKELEKEHRDLKKR